MQFFGRIYFLFVFLYLHRSPLSSPDSLLHCSAVWLGQCDPHSAVAAPQYDGGAPVNYTITVSPGLSPVTTSGTSVPVTVPYNVIHTVSIVATNCNGSSSAAMLSNAAIGELSCYPIFSYEGHSKLFRGGVAKVMFQWWI